MIASAPPSVFKPNAGFEPGISHGLHVRRHLRHRRADPGKRRRANHVDRRSLQLRSWVLRESPCRQARSGERARYESPAQRCATWCYSKRVTPQGVLHKGIASAPGPGKEAQRGKNTPPRPPRGGGGGIDEKRKKNVVCVKKNVGVGGGDK